MNIDKQALRKVAEKAQAARARLESFPDEDGVLFEDDDIKSDVSACNKFFVLATPATMLALLDENIQLQREKDAIEAVALALALRDDMRDAREKLEAAEHRIAEHRKVLNSLAAVARRYLPDYDEHPEIQAADELLESAAGIGVKGGVRDEN
ncbi:ead/Ea22-like family protein [Salmonella enterica subsp. salamae]|nr:ead/Ea22-like family protein [Salmonella enterica subsp. salamae]